MQPDTPCGPQLIARTVFGSMITRREMIPLMLQACPSLGTGWQSFVEEYKDEEELPLYIALGELACHMIRMLEVQDIEGLQRAFAVVERWHIDGDAYVREAATVGLLEDIQNSGLHESTEPEQFRRFLLRESERWWDKLYNFWERGELLTDE